MRRLDTPDLVFIHQELKKISFKDYFGPKYRNKFSRHSSQFRLSDYTLDFIGGALFNELLLFEK